MDWHGTECGIDFSLVLLTSQQTSLRSGTATVDGIKLDMMSPEDLMIAFGLASEQCDNCPSNCDASHLQHAGPICCSTASAGSSSNVSPGGSMDHGPRLGLMNKTSQLSSREKPLQALSVLPRHVFAQDLPSPPFHSCGARLADQDHPSRWTDQDRVISPTDNSAKTHLSHARSLPVSVGEQEIQGW